MSSGRQERNPPSDISTQNVHRIPDGRAMRNLFVGPKGRTFYPKPTDGHPLAFPHGASGTCTPQIRICN
jgi:hypothetical protein